MTEVHANLSQAAEQIQSLKDNIAQVFIGQTAVVDDVLTALISAGHVLIEGVPGLGKTLLVRSLAQTFSGSFARIQFTPDLMPADITGHALFDMKSQQFTVRKGPVFANVLLADEINRAPAKTQAALLEVMQEQQVTLEGKTYEVPKPFITLATQNPVEQEGTYPLPEAQLDRFLLKTHIDYPDSATELALVKTVTANQIGDGFQLSSISQVLTPETIATWQQEAAKITMTDAVLDYAVRLIRATRESHFFRFGAGPRATIALTRCAKSRALMAGDAFVDPDYIKSSALAVLRHRVSLAAQMALNDPDIDMLLQEVIESVDAPRQ